MSEPQVPQVTAPTMHKRARNPRAKVRRPPAGRVVICYEEGLVSPKAKPRSYNRAMAKIAAVLGVESLPKHPTQQESDRMREAARIVRAQENPKSLSELHDGLTVAQRRDLEDAKTKLAASLRAQFQQQVDTRVAELAERMREREQEAEDMQVRLKARLASLTALMSHDEYKLIRSCLHPDKAPADRMQRFTEAFQIFQRLEATANPNLPVTELRARGWDHLAPYKRPA